jgi:hypothetical protein
MRALLDELCSPAELLDQLPTHTGKLEVLLGSPDAVARRFQASGESGNLLCLVSVS